jgi:hypothetical protein
MIPKRLGRDGVGAVFPVLVELEELRYCYRLWKIHEEAREPWSSAELGT